MTISREATPQQVAGRLDHYRLIDVREPAELVGELGHIDGIENVPLGQIDEAGSRLIDERPILFVCRSGMRSKAACDKLAALGQREVVNLTGGMIAWNEAGLPVVGASGAGKK